jgi:hypothetical protein
VRKLDARLDFAIFSALRGRRPRKTGSAECVAEFSHGLGRFLRGKSAGPCPRPYQCGLKGRSFIRWCSRLFAVAVMSRPRAT